ncbi:hypothetical protein JL722_14995 [Aureococcus anophagefferens]|nr:hypothetical protein JL722_14995 [Aureococcus anophagefferens]
MAALAPRSIVPRVAFGLQRVDARGGPGAGEPHLHHLHGARAAFVSAEEIGGENLAEVVEAHALLPRDPRAGTPARVVTAVAFHKRRKLLGLCVSQLPRAAPPAVVVYSLAQCGGAWVPTVVGTHTWDEAPGGATFGAADFNADASLVVCLLLTTDPKRSGCRRSDSARRTTRRRHGAVRGAVEARVGVVLDGGRRGLRLGLASGFSGALVGGEAFAKQALVCLDVHPGGYELLVGLEDEMRVYRLGHRELFLAQARDEGVVPLSATTGLVSTTPLSALAYANGGHLFAAVMGRLVQVFESRGAGGPAGLLRAAGAAGAAAFGSVVTARWPFDGPGGAPGDLRELPLCDGAVVALTFCRRDDTLCAAGRGGAILVCSAGRDGFLGVRAAQGRTRVIQVRFNRLAADQEKQLDDLVRWKRMLGEQKASLEETIAAKDGDLAALEKKCASSAASSRAGMQNKAMGITLNRKANELQRARTRVGECRKHIFSRTSASAASSSRSTSSSSSSATRDRPQAVVLEATRPRRRRPAPARAAPRGPEPDGGAGDDDGASDDKRRPRRRKPSPAQGHRAPDFRTERRTTPAPRGSS